MAHAAEFFVAVPSYRRETVIGDKTLALLARHGVPNDRVYVFVADENERQRYVAQLGERWPKIITGVPTLWRQRNFITEYFEEGSHVLSLDDDVEEVYQLKGDPLNGGVLEPLHAGGLVDIICDAGRKMHRLGVYLWSLNVSDNPYFMNNDEHGCGLTLKNGLCNGFFWGCRIRKDPKLSLRCGDGHEDVERTVRFLDVDGAVLRYREFCAKTRCKTNAGGLQASMTHKQRQSEEERSVNLLVREFPMFLESVPGSKLGVKFRSALGRLRQHSTFLPRQFQKCAARKRLDVLVGSRFAFVCSGSARGYCIGTIEHIWPDKAMLGLKSQEGKLLLASTLAFNTVLTNDQLFVVWLPPAACVELGIAPSGNAEDLPFFLKHDSSRPKPQLMLRESFTSDAVDIAAESGSLSEFAKYLDSLTCNDACGSDDEGGEASSPADTSQQVEDTKRSSKAARKKNERHEDADWIHSQISLTESSKDAAADSGCQQKHIDILQDWAISTDDFESALKRMDEQQKVSTNTSGGGILCCSRIWGGGWGGQCTRPRLKGDEYCKMHRGELDRQHYLTHGRADGPVPPKKRKEFEKWQTILCKRQENNASSAIVVAAGQALTDATDYSEEGWRSMCRGAGESARAYEFRTGKHGVAERKDRKSQQLEKAKEPGKPEGKDRKSQQLEKAKEPGQPGRKKTKNKQPENQTELKTIVRKRPACNKPT